MYHKQNISVRNILELNISATKHIGYKKYWLINVSATKRIDNKTYNLKRTFNGFLLRYKLFMSRKIYRVQCFSGFSYAVGELLTGDFLKPHENCRWLFLSCLPIFLPAFLKHHENLNKESLLQLLCSFVNPLAVPQRLQKTH